MTRSLFKASNNERPVPVVMCLNRSPWAHGKSTFADSSPFSFASYSTFGAGPIGGGVVGGEGLKGFIRHCLKEVDKITILADVQTFHYAIMGWIWYGAKCCHGVWEQFPCRAHPILKNYVFVCCCRIELIGQLVKFSATFRCFRAWISDLPLSSTARPSMSEIFSSSLPSALEVFMTTDGLP